MMVLAAAALQEAAIRTPDTSGYMKAGYAAIALILLGYAALLWARARKSL